MKRGTSNKLLNQSLLQSMVNTAIKKTNLTGIAPEWVMTNRILTKCKSWTINELVARKMIPAADKPNSAHFAIVNQNVNAVADLLKSTLPEKAEAIQKSIKAGAKAIQSADESLKTQNNTVGGAKVDAVESQTPSRGSK